MSRCSIAFVALFSAGLISSYLAPPAHAGETIWRFDNLQRIGGITPRVEGTPKLVESPVGKAVQFNGKTDALFFDDRPLVGAKTFTIEAIFRPEGGAFEQRWMHIVETDPVTGLDALPAGTSDPNPRFMFETRVKDGHWYLDAFVNSKSGSKALIFPEKLHPLGHWYAVAQSYDGKTYRMYVNGVLEGEAEVAFTPHGPGHVMVGVRINHVNWFTGSVALARFTDAALPPEKLLNPPQ